MEQYIDNIAEFAQRNKLFFAIEGECGFGRKCVGLLYRDNYVNYNPTDDVSYDYIKQLYDERLFDIVPQDAYHKHNCLAVLGRGEKAVRQLSEWVDKLKALDVTIEQYQTGATGIQILASGSTGTAIKVNKPL